MQYNITIQGMSCSHCQQAVEKALLELGEGVSVDLSTGNATVTTRADKTAVVDAIESIGYDVVSVSLGQ